MRVERAEVMGMCEGVRRALQIGQGIALPSEVTILGELVHNEQVADHLAARGFEACAPWNRGCIPSTPTVLITAHGISQRRVRQLETAGKRLIDATCPFVRRIHDTALALAEEGRFVVVIGKPGHVEVDGIVGDLERCAVVANAEDVVWYPGERLGIVCQSTASADVAQHVLARIRTMNPGKDLRYLHTICPATHDRQAAVRALIDHVNALVVVGGLNSNNTLELVNIARAAGAPCFHVQTADDIRPEWFRAIEVVGLTAGASTPDESIEAVHGRLAAISKTSREKRGAGGRERSKRAAVGK